MWLEIIVGVTGVVVMIVVMLLSIITSSSEELYEGMLLGPVFLIIGVTIGLMFYTSLIGKIILIGAGGLLGAVGLLRVIAAVWCANDRLK
jgi:hypothetical protein